MENQNQLPDLPNKGTSFARTCSNGLNVLSGIGILSVSFALSQGGWLSLIIFLLVAITFWYTGVLLQRCMAANPLLKSYPDIGGLAFGNKGRAAVSIVLYLEMYLVAVEFLILEGDNLENLFPDMGFKFGGLNVKGKHVFIPFSALLVLPTTWLSLGSLAYVSFGGVLASAILFGCVLWAGAIDGVGFHERGALLKLDGLITTISLFAFSYCSHYVFPMLRSSMKDKTQFPKVLLVCFAASTISNGSIAILGYLMYGENVKSQITLNLPVEKISGKIAIWATVINPLTKYAAVTKPITCAVENACGLRGNRLMSMMIRIVLVISTAVVASYMPFFAYVMALTGASLSLMSSILIPCCCYLKINKAARRFGVELMIIVVILVMGFSIGCLGTYQSILEILKRL